MATKSVTRVEHGFSSEQLYRLSGLALLAALPLQVVGYLLHPPNEEVQQVLQATYGPAHVVLFASWLLALLGLPGLYARQARRAGRLGLVGFVATMVAVAYHSYLLLYEGFAVPIMARQPATQALLGADGPLAHGAGALGVLAFALPLAFAVLGVATVRAGVFPRGVGWLQIASVPAFVVIAIVLGIALDGQVGPEGTSWVGGMLPISVLYWLLFAGYAWGGAVLRSAPEGRAATAAQAARPAGAAG
ncbi:MAG: hypothetical protein M3493_05010 [Actinomycetota bacterium]|jgi:hypothetical protein|nr:hypothetical protein [Euzebyaceae bacterium]MDQ3452048.1 hypothetical protein [Actinomycetota bacterium]